MSYHGGSSPTMPGSSPTMPTLGAPTDGDPISSGMSDGPASVVGQNQLDFNLFKAKMYEEDGDSILGSLLPNVYIKKITLDESSPQEGKLVDRDPHIKTDYPDQNQMITDALYQGSQPLKVSINLLIKEKVENDDVSLFTVEKITKALRIRVMVGLNKNCITMIKTAGNTINYENPQEIGKLISGDLFPGPTSASPFFPFAYNIGPDGLSYKGQDMVEYRYIDISLSDLPQFKALINEVTGNNAKQNQEALSAKFLLSLDKETLSDGTRLYNIPVSVPPVIIPNAHGGTNIENLTVFAVSYIDYNTLIDLDQTVGQDSTLDFVNSKKDQFANVGYNTTAFSIDKIAQYFEEFMDDYGSGIAAIKDVIKNGKLAKTNDIFVYSDTDIKYQTKYGKKWSGPVHYHGPNNKGPNGYVGYMGGTSMHMGTDKPTPKLIKTKMVSEGEILDFRNTKLIDELILNYADFGFDNNFKELVSPVPPSLQKTGAEALYERETKSNSWLKAKQKKMFSDPMFSLRQDGSCAFLFTLDLDKIIRYNTMLPGLYQTLPLQEYINVLSGLKINSIKIFRHEVSNFLDNKGMPYIDESEQIPVLIADATANNGNNLSGVNADTGIIQEIPLNDGDNSGVFLKHIMVTDVDIKKQKSNRKKFQYSIELVAEDPVMDYLKSKVNSYIAPLKNILKDYLQFATNTKSYFDVHSNTFTSHFHEAFNQSGFAGGGAINASFLQGVIGTSMQSFLNNFLFTFKNFSTSQKIDISTYMTTLTSPLFGNPSGISVVLKHVELFEKKVLDLIDIQRSVVGSKTKHSSQEVMFERLQAKGSKPPKNQISVQTLLDGSFDSNDSGEVGYTYLKKESEANLAGLLNISHDNFLARILVESQKYSFSDIDTDGLGISVGDVASQNLRYLTPLEAKTINGKKSIGTSKQSDVETLISILETNVENTSGAEEAQFEISSDTAEAPNLLIGGDTYPSLKKKIPNMMRILENADLSITNKGDNLPLIYNPTSTSSIKASPSVVSDFNSSVKTGAQAVVDNLPSGIKKISESIFDVTDINNSLIHFPTTTKDTSQLVATLMTMQKIDVYSVDKIIILLLAVANKINILPNHIKKVISDITSAQLGNALDELRINYDNFVNMSSIALAHGNLVELEYFEKFGQFGLLSVDIKDKKFKPLTSEVLTSLKGSSKGFLLVRMKPYSNFNIVDPATDVRLPIFDEYFLLKLN